MMADAGERQYLTGHNHLSLRFQCKYGVRGNLLQNSFDLETVSSFPKSPLIRLFALHPKKLFAYFKALPHEEITCCALQTHNDSEKYIEWIFVGADDVFLAASTRY